MAGPGLPVNVDSTYADDGADASVKAHQQHHDAVHAIVNHIDAGTLPAGNGQVWVSVSDVMTPRALTAADVAAVPLAEHVNTAATGGAAQTIAAVTADTINDITLTATCTLTFPAATAGTSFTLILRQGGAGSFTVVWPTVKWPGGAAPVLSTAIGTVDIFSFIYVTDWYGFAAGLGMA